MVTDFVVTPLVVSVDISMGAFICDDKNIIWPNKGKKFGFCQSKLGMHWRYSACTYIKIESLDYLLLLMAAQSVINGSAADPL